MVMKYIENLELREWVKDSLKKTIFQKAHALAIQTGCQILVKLEDDYDPTRHQYYATDKLRKVFKNNGLRQQAGEKFVSGVTGEPLIDQAIQSDAASQDERTNNVVEQGSTCSEVEVTSQGSGPDEERLMPEERLDSDNVASGGEEAIPMQLSLTAESFPSETADDGVNLKTEVTDEDMPTDVQIKVERIDDDPGGGTGSMGGGGDTSSAPMFGGFDPNTTGQSDSSSSTQFQSVPPVTPLVQYQSTYQVPMSPKPYQCAMCGKTFRSVQVLQKHTQTFHMKTQHAMMGVRRGRGRPPVKLNRPQPRPSSFTCVMCHITFPDAEILQDHMTRTHMGGGTPQPQETLDDFSAPGTSQESAMPTFVIPHTQSSPGDASPAASQASPYSSQSSAPVFPRNVSAAEGKPGTSAGTSRDLLPSMCRNTPPGSCNLSCPNHLKVLELEEKMRQQQMQQRLSAMESRMNTLISHESTTTATESVLQAVLDRPSAHHSTAVLPAHSAPGLSNPKPTLWTQEYSIIWSRLNIVKDEHGNIISATVKDEEKKKLLLLGNDVKRTKLAKVLMKRLFTEEERLTQNCSGTKKGQLDPIRMGAVESAVFDLRPAIEKSQLKCWRECIVAMNQSNRDLKRRREGSKKKAKTFGKH